MGALTIWLGVAVTFAAVDAALAVGYLWFFDLSQRERPTA